MKRFSRGLLLAGVIGSLSASVGATDDEKPSNQAIICPDRWGKPGKPLVSSKATSLAIFRAVEDDFNPQAQKEKFPEVSAEDDGTYWTVYRHRPTEVLEDGRLLSFRGGGLSMHIAKCNGAISEVYFQR